MNRKGFTLVEVLIVVIIIGILAAIGIPQFAAAIERAKGGEARAALGHIQTAEKIYFAENEAYYAVDVTKGTATVDLSANLDIMLTQKYWEFDVAVQGIGSDGSTPTLYTATATRGGTGTTAGQYIKMDHKGTIWGTWTYLSASETVPSS